MAPPSKGLKTSSADHIRAFNVAAAEYKALASERTLADLEKILAVLTKITDVSGVWLCKANGGAGLYRPDSPESTEWFIEDQAFTRSYDCPVPSYH